MAIRVKTSIDGVPCELGAKLGNLGMEIVMDEEDIKILNPIADIPEDDIYKEDLIESEG